MFSNYFYLKRLTKELAKEFVGLRLMACFSQNKDELIIGFASEKSERWIRANLDPNIALLSFPESFARAKKNSIDLFTEVIDTEVLDIKVFKFERSFQLFLSEDFSFVFKMHGRRANILLVKETKILSAFRKNLVSNEPISDLNKEIVINEVTFQENDYNPTALIPAIGKKVMPHWEQKSSQITKEELWPAFQELLKELDSNPIYLTEGENPSISLVGISDLQTHNAIEAANWLYSKKTRWFYLDKERNQLINSLQQQIKKSENYIFKTSEKLRLVSSNRSPEELANILMANLHVVQQGLSSVTLADFYDQGFVEIKLNPKLSPAKNAENYYRKSKNRHQEIDNLKQNIADKERKIGQLQSKIESLGEIDNTKELRKFAGQSKKGSNKPDQIQKPYHEFLFEDWVIMIGKNAKANDELTLKIANKDDLWLHAKDVSGSHVVIRQRPGQKFANNVIEYAASLAAYNSKRKTDSLCPVIYTLKKNVRKMKGTPAGQVIVDKEEVLMIEPLA